MLSCVVSCVYGIQNIGSHCGDNRRSCSPGGLAENEWDTFVFAAAVDLTVSQFSNYK